MGISGNSRIPEHAIEGMAAGGYGTAKRLINKNNVDDDLASLNPISKPGTTPWQVDDYNKSKWTKPGVRIPELNPTTEYGGNYSKSTRIEPLVQKMHKAFIQNRVNEGVARTKPVMDLNIGGPKEVPGVETGWIQQNDRLEYRPEVPVNINTREQIKFRRKTKKTGLRRRKQDIN